MATRQATAFPQISNYEKRFCQGQALRSVSDEEKSFITLIPVNTMTFLAKKIFKTAKQMARR